MKLSRNDLIWVIIGSVTALYILFDINWIAGIAGIYCLLYGFALNAYFSSKLLEQVQVLEMLKLECGCGDVFTYETSKDNVPMGAQVMCVNCATTYVVDGEMLERFREAARMLPLEAFDKDIDQLDAADYKDHADEFYNAMLYFRRLLNA